MQGIYNGGLTREQFLFYEIRIVASLLSQGLSRKEVTEKIKEENLFQFPTERTLNLITNCCYKRIDALNSKVLAEHLASAPIDVAKQINLYAMMKYNRIVWDFMTTVIGEKYRTQDLTFSKKDTNVFFYRLQEQNDAVASWSELHNLLKKVVDCDKYNDMSFSRQPMIQFGTFDRTQAIYDIIVAFSPITSDELIEYVVSEYGYDVTAAQNYMQPLRKYFHQGVYSVEFKRIPYDRIEVLEAELPDEFYYISEIKALYKKLFENADIEEINPRSLKALGYTVFSSYVLKNYTNADAYFKDVLNSKDVFSLKELSKRYGYCSAYTTVLYDMRKNYDILLFEENQCINFRKIEKLGITKNDIKEFCNEVYDLIDENQYFTIRSLQEFDINTKLESLGFDEIFLGGILAMSTKFLYTQIFGGIVLYKGQNVPGISKKSYGNSFVYRTLERQKSVRKTRGYVYRTKYQDERYLKRKVYSKSSHCIK